MTKDPKPELGSPCGCWNAYVAAGKDRMERTKRLDEAPPHMRATIRSHVETVMQIRKWKKENGTSK